MDCVIDKEIIFLMVLLSAVWFLAGILLGAMLESSRTNPEKEPDSLALGSVGKTEYYQDQKGRIFTKDIDEPDEVEQEDGMTRPGYDSEYNK